jgi:argininosuccinate lyase
MKETEEGVVRSRFGKKMDETALMFSSSLDHDKNIFYYVILVDMAHILNLMKSLYVSEEEAKELLKAIIEIRNEGFETLGNYEDVHEAIEAKLIDKVGDSGRKIQTAKSRNDEIATCLRLFARDRLLLLMDSLLELRRVLLQIAIDKKDVIMPGFTHLQPAQPTKLSHHIIAYHDMFSRDFERMMQVFRRINQSPLGSAAFTTTSFEIDRERIAEFLGFDGIVDNSADAVSSRDFSIEAVFVGTSILLTLSRIAEEIILWTSEFNFIELPDEFASSSSIMPQKKNPDIAELIRAKSGRIIGNLTAMMSMYKALPLTYNRDFQDMNSLLYEALEISILSTGLMARMLDKIDFKEDIMDQKAGKKFTVATELANMLVRKANIPFRSAHEIVGRIAMQENASPSIDDIDRAAMEVAGRKVSESISKDDLEKALNPAHVVEATSGTGGTSEEQIKRMLDERILLIEEDEDKLSDIVETVSKKLEKLYSEVAGVID